jgi:acyl carrier protein
MNICLDRTTILQVVLRALENANSSRPEGSRLDISPEARIFGAPSPLDSLGLVALLIDVEEAVADLGIAITLSDERALSQRRSPFRDVPSLVSYIETLITEDNA